MNERLYIINGRFLRANMTGVQRVAIELSNALAALKAEDHPSVAGYRFEVWHPHDGREAAREVALPCREIGPGTGILWEQTTLPLRANGTLLNLCNVGPAIRRDAITMIHDAQVLLSPQSYSRQFRLYYGLLQPLIGRLNHCLLTVSDFSRGELVAAGVARKGRIHTVHNGVDHVLRVAADRGAIARLGRGGRPYVLALSTVQAHKNVAMLVDAFARPELGRCDLVLFGSTGREAFEAAGHPPGANVHFAGRVTDAELRGLMEGAVALAFPSRTEGFGLPPLEAMRVGCPAICAPCGALPEVCGDAALFAPADDPAAWAAMIVRLIEDGAFRETMVRKGIDHSAGMTWRESALTLMRALHQCRDGAGERRPG